MDTHLKSGERTGRMERKSAVSFIVFSLIALILITPFAFANTYIRSQTGDVLINTSNATRMNISSNGNVAIGGLNTQGAKLFVNGDIRTAGGYNVIGSAFEGSYVNSGYTVNPFIFQNPYGGNVGWQFRTQGNVGSAVMTINESGNVGIGTTAPWDRLTVVGDGSLTSGEHPVAQFGASANGNGPSLGYRANGTSITSTLIRSDNTLPLVIGTSGSNTAVTIDNFGRIGIEANASQISPSSSHLLTVGSGLGSPNVDLNAAHNGAANINFVAGSGASGSILGSIEYSMDAAEYAMKFYSGGLSERMRITSLGNVGIGTTAPEAKFTVSGGDVRINGGGVTRSLYFDGNAILTKQGSDGRIILQSAAAGTELRDGSGTTRLFLNDTTGNIGIGTTSPANKLDVGGVVKSKGLIIDNNGGNGFLFSVPSYSNPKIGIFTEDTVHNYGRGSMIFAVNNVQDASDATLSNEVMRIHYNGNVGIGTTSPQQMLHMYNGGIFRIQDQDNVSPHGYVEFGTTESGAWSRKGYIGLPGAGSAEMAIASDGAGTPIYFKTNSGTVMTINTTNVDIGPRVYSAYYNSRLNLENTAQDGTALSLYGPGSTGAYLNFANVNIGGQSDNKAFLRWTRDSSHGRKFSVFVSDNNAVSREALVVDYGGNVGIGTTAPSSKLDVRGIGTNAGGVATGLVLAHVGSMAGDGPGIEFTYGNAGIGGGQNIARIMGYTQGGGGGDILFQTAPSASGAYTTKMTLERDGDVRVGTGTTGCVKDADGTVIAGSCSSDLRFKTNIQPLSSTLNKVAQLQPVTFNWKAKEFPQKAFGTETQVGLVAQDVEKIFPQLVNVDKDGYKTVDYTQLNMLMLQSIKDLKQENDGLKARVALLEQQMDRK